MHDQMVCYLLEYSQSVARKEHDFGQNQLPKYLVIEPQETPYMLHVP